MSCFRLLFVDWTRKNCRNIHNKIYLLLALREVLLSKDGTRWKPFLSSSTLSPKSPWCKLTWFCPNGLLDQKVMIHRIVPSPVLQMNKLDHVHLFCSLFWKISTQCYSVVSSWMCQISEFDVSDERPLSKPTFVTVFGEKSSNVPYSR